MAGTLSACPREECVLTDQATSPAQGAARPPAFSEAGGGVRLLRGAAFVQLSLLALSQLTPLALPDILLVAGALIVAALAFALPGPNDGSVAHFAAEQQAAETQTDLSQKTKGSGASPSPLPFIGERIVPGSGDAANFSGLAHAARRLGRMSPMRRQIWADLTARVSHELRTPLNAVIGFSDVLAGEMLGPVGHPRYREYAVHIRDCSRELLKSAEDTLAITSLLDHDPNAKTESAVDFQAIAEEAWGFHAEPPGRHGLSLNAEIPEGLAVLIEKRPLRQVLINLFAEAVRRSDARGTVGLVATVAGDLVQIEVFLKGRPDSKSVGQASLPVSLAHALLELQGASLIEVDDPHATWRAVTVLKCAAQDDFFASHGSDDAAPAEPAAMQLC